MENNLTIEKAIEILSQVSSQYKGTLEEHRVILQAIDIIKLATIKNEKIENQENQRES